MIIEVKTVEILAKQKMQFEATTVVKEEKLIKFMTGFKNSLKETRNDGYIKEVALHLGDHDGNVCRNDRNILQSKAVLRSFQCSGEEHFPQKYLLVWNHRCTE